MIKIELNGQWNFRQKDNEKYFPVNIPGSVISGLLENGQIEDPYYRRNEYPTRELFRNDYEFSREFYVSKEELSQNKLELVCEGLDTLADIFVNENKIAHVENMHRTWRFSVKDYLQEGKNNIRIVFYSVLEYIDNYQYGENRKVLYTASGAMYGNHLIRKPHSMFGWDWGPQLPDAGINRDIYIECYTEARLKDVIIHQTHGDKVILDIKALVAEELPEGGFISCKIKEAGKKDSEEMTIKSPCEREWTGQIEIENPKLWWPNGYGEQNLYEVLVVIMDKEGNALDSWNKNIGLRTLTISQTPDKWGKEFAFIVNGVKIFAMGGNYIPEDAIYSRITHKRQEYLLESCKRAHFNCIRIWGGGYYPSDYFYDLCDKKGLIVWQDLMYACNVYEVTDDFGKNCREEAIDNARRLRHHASLGLWCGNNEIESAWSHWGDFQIESMYLRADYIRLFEEILPKALREADDTTFYWPSSPSSGGCISNPDDVTCGDTHYWDVWHGQKPFSDYKNHYFRFCSEFGFQSYPCMKTVETFTEESDRNVFSRVMESHQKNDSANGKMLYYLSENFRYPDTFKHLLYVSQVLQGIAVKSGVDHWRRHRGRCMGALYWQVNDNWPVASWASIDYFGRWKALHYMACRFFAPLAVSLVMEKEEVKAYIENESADKRRYTAELTIRDMNCNVLGTITKEGEVEGRTSCEIAQMELAEYRQWEETAFVTINVTMDDGCKLSDIETLLPFKYLNLPKPQINVSVEEAEDEYRITLQSDCFAPYVEMDFDDADVIFEDNYFSLTDGKPYTVTFKKDDILNGEFKNAEDVQKRLRLCTVADTY